MRRNLLLLAALAMSIAANVAITRDPAHPNLEVMPEMVHSISYKAYAANPNFPDGKTLQLPPQGTIPRGSEPLDYSASPEDAARAGRELRNPFKDAMPGAQARGQFVFQTFCIVCHGPAGKGDGPVAQRGFPPPPPLTAQHALGLADGQIFHILTYGQKNMPSYAAQLSRDDRWKVILYVRSLQQGASRP